MEARTRKPRPASRETALPSAFGCGLAVASTLLGCQVAVVDLGRTSVDAGAEAGTGTPIALEPLSTQDCPTVSELEVSKFYGKPCDSTCADGNGPPRDIASPAELVGVTSARWRTCAGDVPWAADVVGIEFQPGCTLFLLHDTPDGGTVRGTMPADQGQFNVIEPWSGTSVARPIELYFPHSTYNNWRVSVTTSDCPHRMRFEGADGGAIDFTGIPSAGPNPQ